MRALPTGLRQTDGLRGDEDRGLRPQRRDAGEGDESAATSRRWVQVGELAQAMDRVVQIALGDGVEVLGRRMSSARVLCCGGSGGMVDLLSRVIVGRPARPRPPTGGYSKIAPAALRNAAWGQPLDVPHREDARPRVYEGHH